ARRLANSVVKMGGICWAITKGTGKFAGKEGSSLARASGPPVDTPIATMPIREDRVEAMCVRDSGRAGRAIGSLADVVGAGARAGRWHSSLIFGTRSRRIASDVAAI